ncbi:MAG: hypothetical protein CFE29_19290 [Bradyrhizobiaceae bacterium PARB1]|jgi:Cysteine rich repeat|nr:MAG: hypothetical protein CFE29_19290 [Bradyrhizobiaceae bacterium PARB1]
MRKILLALTVITASASTGALAQQIQNRGGTEAEQKACSRDVQKLCRHVMDQGDLVILSCLKENRPKISKTCNDVLVSHGQ